MCFETIDYSTPLFYTIPSLDIARNIDMKSNWLALLAWTLCKLFSKKIVFQVVQTKL